MIKSHGFTTRINGKQDRTYTCWVNMRHRCLRPSHKEYGLYGGRGITICERWMDFSNFLQDMGEKHEGKSLDRINNNGHYGPDNNCQWATPLQQATNRRTTIYLRFAGREQTLWEWADELGIKRGTLYFRYRRGWTTERLLSQTLQIKTGQTSKNNTSSVLQETGERSSLMLNFPEQLKDAA